MATTSDDVRWMQVVTPSPEPEHHDDQFLVSRLVARIADLEQRLFTSEFEDKQKGSGTETVLDLPKMNLLSNIKTRLLNPAEHELASGPAIDGRPADLDADLGLDDICMWLLPPTPADRGCSAADTPQPPPLHSLASTIAANKLRQAASCPSGPSNMLPASSSSIGDISAAWDMGGCSMTPSTTCTSRSSSGSEWFPMLFRAGQSHPPTPPSDDAESCISKATGYEALPWNGRTADPLAFASGMHRCGFDPADIAAELEVTARVRKVAAEVLMEAEAKLAHAQARVQEHMENCEQLSRTLETLRRENAQILATRRALEAEMASSRHAVEAMRAAQESLQQELEELRAQAAACTPRTTSAKDGKRSPGPPGNTEVREQMRARLNELKAVKTQLTESEAVRQKQAKDLKVLQGKVQSLTKVNKQLEADSAELAAMKDQVPQAYHLYRKERVLRRKMQASLKDINGAMRVVCRVRPTEGKQASIITFPAEGAVAVHPISTRSQEFEFDRVFGGEEETEAIYEELRPLLRASEGGTVCMFSYGPTCTGKTHSVQGCVLAAAKDLFNMRAPGDMYTRWTWEVRVLLISSHDHVFDLLIDPEEGYEPLDIAGLGQEELAAGTERVPQALWIPVTSLDDITKILEHTSVQGGALANALRTTLASCHVVTSLRATSSDGTSDKQTTIHLVDLAGCERTDTSTECQSINKSLGALGDVITALQQGMPEVPYNSARLTQVLQGALSVRHKAMFLCHVAPELAHAQQTMAALGFCAQLGQAGLRLGNTKRASGGKAN